MKRLEVSCAVRLIYTSLGAKELNAIVIFPLFMILDGLTMVTIGLNMLPY